MTDLQKQRIQAMRGDGDSYAKIAAALNISENTVKSYCKRNNLGGRAGCLPPTIEDPTGVCKRCGKPVAQIPGRKPRKFCSASCRSAWWAAHPDQIRQKALYGFTCPSCGKAFTAYGNAKRKYCSHACYIAARFGGGGNG